MKILIASDKFKGSMSAQTVCEAIGKGLENDSALEMIYYPMADGGDGSLNVLSNHLSFSKNKVLTVDPIGRVITCHYLTYSDFVFIELASASGLTLLSENEKNPLLTSTIGTGKMIADAISNGYKKIYLLLGGSATNDAGMGIATELGFQFLDKNKNELLPIGKNLVDVKFISYNSIFDLEKIKFTLLCDVQNPMYGTTGAAFVYAAQKGATNKQISFLDEGLKNFSSVLEKYCGRNISQLAGGGAAGGIGAGLVGLLNAELKRGFESIATLTNLEEQIKNADWVISGEGKLDEQSLEGKVISGIATLCKKHQKPLALFVGKNELTFMQMNELNAKYIFSISDVAENFEDAMFNGEKYLTVLANTFRENIICS